MVTVQRRARTIAADRRVWGVTCVLVGSPAFGILAGANVVLELATPLVYAYLLVLGAIGGTFPGVVPFWIGFALFCFVVATVLVGTFDWVRNRRAGPPKPVGNSTVDD